MAMVADCRDWNRFCSNAAAVDCFDFCSHAGTALTSSFNDSQVCNGSCLMPPLSKMSPGSLSLIGLAVVAASVAVPANMQAGAFTAGLIPMATIAEVDRSANPLDLPDTSQVREITHPDSSNSAGAGSGFRMGSNQQRMLISGHDGSASGGDIAGAFSFRRRSVQGGSGGMGTGGGSGGSGSSGTNPPPTSAGPIVSNPNGPTSGPPVFHNPPVTPGDVFNPPSQQGGNSQFVPSGINNTDIVGPDSSSPTNFPDTTTANVTESPLSFPEPGSMTLLSVGVAGLLVWRRRCDLRPS